MTNRGWRKTLPKGQKNTDQRRRKGAQNLEKV